MIDVYFADIGIVNDCNVKNTIDIISEELFSKPFLKNDLFFQFFNISVGISPLRYFHNGKLNYSYIWPV